MKVKKNLFQLPTYIIASLLLVTMLSKQTNAQAQPPYPKSTVITDITWAPVDTTIYKAKESDNWPLTWADDGNMYTTYGDGWGFEPKVEKKLSMGFAKIVGDPENFQGINIRSPDETIGQGRKGKKASGILYVDNTLYILVRNANLEGQQSILAWSTDYMKTWEWANWQWEHFGHPAFLNFGKNYSGVPSHLQGYIYFYSPDTPDAYNETDDVILARAPISRIKQKDAYEFFNGTTDNNKPIWTKDITQRESVFHFPNASNRLDVTYNAGLNRYLMTMRSRGEGGGKNNFGIYDAPEPWGPWTTVYYSKVWEENGEIVPLSNSNKHWGEVAHIPSKWISKNGKEFYLVFAGNDSFAVRKAVLSTN